MLTIIRKHGVCIRRETMKTINSKKEEQEEGFPEAFLKGLVQLRDEICGYINQVIHEHNKRCPLHLRFSIRGVYLDAPENQQCLIKNAQDLAIIISDAMDDGSITKGKTAWAKVLSQFELCDGSLLKTNTWRTYL